jgi:NAD-dependent SIR2 family protein deacetylase
LRSLDRVVGDTTDPTDPAEALAATVEQLRTGGVLVLTGAGISTDSGIPDYRGEHGSLRRSRPMTFQEFAASAQARRRYWARGFVGLARLREAHPNLSHHIVASWQSRGLLAGVVTQNVDGLHAAAGTQDVVAMHGDMAWVDCLDCGHREPRAHFDQRLEAANPGFRETIEDEHLVVNADGDVNLDQADVDRFVILHCLNCGSDRLKPSVIYFGENVPATVHAKARELGAAATSLLVLGSSLAVMSGYRFVLEAERAGKRTTVINGGPGRADAKVDVLWRTPLTPALEELDAALRRSGV